MKMWLLSPSTDVGKLKEMVALWEQYKTDNGVLDISLDLSDKVE